MPGTWLYTRGALGVIFFIIRKTQYFVVLGTNAGDVRALSSPDQTRIGTIVDAINNAIVEYK